MYARVSRFLHPDGQSQTLGVLGRIGQFERCRAFRFVREKGFSLASQSHKIVPQVPATVFTRLNLGVQVAPEQRDRNRPCGGGPIEGMVNNPDVFAVLDDHGELAGPVALVGVG